MVRLLDAGREALRLVAAKHGVKLSMPPPSTAAAARKKRTQAVASPPLTDKKKKKKKDSGDSAVAPTATREEA